MKVGLDGQVALVTGAARGIGRAIADLLAANGASVVYSDIDGEAAAESARRAPGSGARSCTLDVTDAEMIRERIDELTRTLGPLDILVNNAGVNTLKHRVPIDEFPREEWDRILDVDLNGVFQMSQSAARVMKPRRSGKIINIASIAGLVPLRLQSAFVAAKAGVINLTRAMALELGPHGILVNAVAPGSTLTEGTKALFYGDDGMFRDSVRQLLAHIPLGRPARPEEIAHAVLFLASPESSYVHGHVLTVDGGWTAGYTRDF